MLWGNVFINILLETLFIICNELCVCSGELHFVCSSHLLPSHTSLAFGYVEINHIISQFLLYLSLCDIIRSFKLNFVNTAETPFKYSSLVNVLNSFPRWWNLVTLCFFFFVCIVFSAEQMFWEVMQLRREMSFTKLGYYKDQLWQTDVQPHTADSPLVLVFLLIWSFQETFHPSLSPSCECVFVWERRTLVVFNHHKDWRTVKSVVTDLEFWWVSVESLTPKYISFFETCSTPIWHEKKLKLKYVGI